MKNDLLFYRGYVATVWLDVKSGVLRGRVEGMNADPIDDSFVAIIHPYAAYDLMRCDEYLAHCEEWGRRPARQYHGVFSVRMDAALHGRLVHWAKVHGMSLNAALVHAAEELLKDQMETD